MKNLIERTEMSIKAEKILKKLIEKGIIGKGSAREQTLNFLFKYPGKEDRNYFEEKGKIDPNKLYNKIIAPYDNQEILLLQRCIELNLSEKEAHEIIKQRFRSCYKDWPNQDGNYGAKEITNTFYPKFCKILEITPDNNFPDW